MNQNMSEPGSFDQAIYTANLAIVAQRWPDIHRQIVAAEIPRSVELTHGFPCKSMVVDGIHLGSCFSRKAEAELQASLIPEENDTAWVYGVGLGDLPRQLLKRSNLRSIQVVCLNFSVLRQSFGNFDHQDWLADSRVNLLSGWAEHEIFFPFAAVPSCLQLAGEQACHIRDLVQLELATPFLKEKNTEKNENLKIRLEENERFLKQDPDVNELFNTRCGQTFVVAGAGPTLSEQYAWINAKRSELVIIAVDAAFKPLAKAGIYPDIVVCIDSHEGLGSFFYDVDLDPAEHIPLVYFPQVFSDVLVSWPGKRFAALSEHPIHSTLREKYSRATLYSSGSVIHPAVDLAVKMGAAEIIFAGADFAFPKGQSHVENFSVGGHETTRTSPHWVLNWRGEKIQTIPNLRGYLRDLERYIDTHPSIKFFNCSQEGAKIRGVLLRSQTN